MMAVAPKDGSPILLQDDKRAARMQRERPTLLKTRSHRISSYGVKPLASYPTFRKLGGQIKVPKDLEHYNTYFSDMFLL